MLWCIGARVPHCPVELCHLVSSASKANAAKRAEEMRLLAYEAGQKRYNASGAAAAGDRLEDAEVCTMGLPVHGCRGELSGARRSVPEYGPNWALSGLWPKVGSEWNPIALVPVSQKQSHGGLGWGFEITARMPQDATATHCPSPFVCPLSLHELHPCPMCHPLPTPPPGPW